MELARRLTPPDLASIKGVATNPVVPKQWPELRIINKKFPKPPIKLNSALQQGGCHCRSLDRGAENYMGCVVLRRIEAKRKSDTKVERPTK
jgi:hypothetical protein